MAVEVGDEPKHRVMLSNEYVRAINVKFAEGEETLIHKHSVDSLYFFLVPPAPVNPLNGKYCLEVLNTIYDADSNIVTTENSFMDYGECRFGTHCEKNLIHKIKCIRSGNGKGVHCVDIELKKSAPNIITDVTGFITVDNDTVKLIKDKEKAIVFHLTIKPSCMWTFDTYPFFYLLLCMKGGECFIQKDRVSWQSSHADGECEWHTPGESAWSIRNESCYDILFYIIQWK